MKLKHIKVPLHKAKSRIDGYGAFASRNIKTNEIIAVWDGPYVKKPPKRLVKYSNYVRDGRWMIGYGKSPESFLNHSRNPNACVFWNGDKAILVAVVAIKKNAEVTFNYNDLPKPVHG